MTRFWLSRVGVSLLLTWTIALPAMAAEKEKMPQSQSMLWSNPGYSVSAAPVRGMPISTRRNP